MRSYAQNQALSVRELLSFLECDCIAMLIRGYIDDSSDGLKKKVAVAGAFLGDYKQWTKLKGEWKRRLNSDGIEYFKYSEYCSLRGQFFRFRDKNSYPPPAGRDAAKSVLSDLEAIIKDSHIRGVAHVIPLEMYQGVRSAIPLAADMFPADAFEAALQSLIRDCVVEFKKHYGNTHRLAFMCDDGSTSSRLLAAYAGFRKVNPELSDILGPLAFGDDKKYPQLQSADLMAGVGREIYLSPAKEHRLAPSIFFVRKWSEQNMMETFAAQLNSLPIR